MPPSSSAFAIRKLTDRYNLSIVHGDSKNWPVRPGQLVTASIINSILRYILHLYSHEENPFIMSGALGWIEANSSEAVSEKSIASFVDYFPPHDVYKGQKPELFISDSNEFGSNQELITQESILLSLSMANPAFRPFHPFYDNTELTTNSPFNPFVAYLEDYFEDKPDFGPLGEPLFECLRAPMKACPNSLEGQLDFIKTKWAKFLPKDLLMSVMLAGDILQEEYRVRGWGPGPNIALEFGKKAYGSIDYEYPEPAAFSRDADWMSNVVILAKTVYVWLDQLSKQYNRKITLLNEVPDEELNKLARWGFSGLWLIGIWERSKASQKIKQIMGNPEAAPSAYSLYDYTIAEDLGGEEAYQDLRKRAWDRGIRLASDMVPNHMGIYSKWVIEHPDWFIQSEHPPFPVYQFTGVNLSEDDNATVQIEDGYWEHRDASVVFKRIDNKSGEVRYIYHGNDGTSTPWNDTAQLNFMKAEVREAVIQTVLHVARKFPIIRFDAAMTLAKKHYQRLWFPQPGDGGAIPSRAEQGMTRPQFDEIFPKEFWREVVDRVAAEVPDTLLLAEAFWLMEGYFVRTLGMHRVYNSAFMNMLKMEENDKYRMTIKNVLEFSPEVLKRFVNFMNNPDEKTAVEQFGKGDKYFGIAVMMVTMPGLPMFGHGQLEGFTEKYGMEYYRAYWDEEVDEGLIRRHEHELFPLMRRRNIFSGSENFALYDFTTSDGWVNENVFAYSNRSGDERAIIIYNNSYDSTEGKIHSSTAINVGSAEAKQFVHRSLIDALQLNTAPGHIYRFCDYRTGLQYLRSGEQLARDGFFTKLYGYQYYAFMDFQEIYDSDGSWSRLMNNLYGGGIRDIDEAYTELQLSSILKPFRDLIYSIFTGRSLYLVKNKEDISGELSIPLKHMFDAIIDHENLTDIETVKFNEVITEAIRQLTDILIESSDTVVTKTKRLNADLILISKIILAIGKFALKSDRKGVRTIAHRRLYDWLLQKNLGDCLSDILHDDWNAQAYASLMPILIQRTNLISETRTKSDWVELLGRDDIGIFLRINSHENERWFNREQFTKLIDILFIHELCIDISKDDDVSTKRDVIISNKNSIEAFAEKSGYQIEKFLLLLFPEKDNHKKKAGN
ncbi:MAG: alpha-amylase [candidate division Zixibacteria bacterium]|nr:alpha-amylase [candidate division Zixibacteria bacterium]